MASHIAIIGISARFPGASNHHEFWDNLIQNKESIQKFEVTEKYEQVENYVPAKGCIDNIEMFDAAYFNFTPAEAKLLDPQHRVLLECATEAIEDAGYSAHQRDTIVSLYAGMADSTYLYNNLMQSEEVLSNHTLLELRVNTSLATFAAQAAYQLNLKGEVVSLNTACSTSLVAVSAACEALKENKCEMAMAGGVAIMLPQNEGYIYQPGGIESKDGHCRPFDVDADGTVFSSGAGVVLLKRLEDAIRDHDHIYATIRGWDVNNDGTEKLGFTAPSVKGQENCISNALKKAEVSAENIQYVEAHGTATQLGDTIEVYALTEAFRKYTDKVGYCRLGSVKSNIGHTDIAAGMAGLIKVVLALKNKFLPGTLHFKKPNPKLKLDSSPFVIESANKKWTKRKTNRFAGVSAFGIGGTNAHVILEEYLPDVLKEHRLIRPYHLFTIAGKTKISLEKNIQNFLKYLKENSPNTTRNAWLSDVSYTINTGRSQFDHRYSFACRDLNDAITKLSNLTAESLKHQTLTKRRVVFLFTGQGSQYYGMARELYETEPYFASQINIACEMLKKDKNEIKHLILARKNERAIKEQLASTEFAQITLFIIEYSLAKLLMYWGINPDALIGHSLGEYTAACIADVISLEDALDILLSRGSLMAKAEAGAMLSVACSKEDIKPYLNDKVEIAAINARQNTVISGDVETINEVKSHLKKNNVPSKIIQEKFGFHSYKMDTVLAEYGVIVNKIDFRSPKIPMISNVTGYWLRDNDATDPDYWVQHMRKPVNFEKGIVSLADDKYDTFVEIGPGLTLTNFVKSIISGKSKAALVVNTLPSQNQTITDRFNLLTCIAKLWSFGINIDWRNYYRDQVYNKLPLPTYAFDKKNNWVDAKSERKRNGNNLNKLPIEKNTYTSTWKKLVYPVNFKFDKSNQWMLIGDNNTLMETIELQLAQRGQKIVVKVAFGESYKKKNKKQYLINHHNEEDYLSLFESLKDDGIKNLKILDISNFNPCHYLAESEDTKYNEVIDLSFFNPLFLAKAYVKYYHDNEADYILLTSASQRVFNDDIVDPLRSVIVGPGRVITHEHFNLRVQVIDARYTNDNKELQALAMQLISYKLNGKNHEGDLKAYRNGSLWKKEYTPISLDQNESRLKNMGVYLVTGGLGGISLAICERIAKSVKSPKFVLITRSPFIKRDAWSKSTLNSTKLSNKDKLRLSKILDLIKLGANVDVQQANIVSYKDTKKLIEYVVSNYKVINGLIHAAGVPGGGIIIRKQRTEVEKVFAPKITGAINLFKTLSQIDLDFFINFSSVSSIIGEPGQVDYCAANSFLDSLSECKLLPKCKFISTINWNTWTEVGMAVDTARPEDVKLYDLDNTISPEQGATIFENAINSDVSQVIVSAYDLNSYIKLVNDNHQESLSALPEIDDGSSLETSKHGKIVHQLQSIWCQVLGYETVDIDDNFFDLGGHSLSALNLLAHINKAFKSDINLDQFYSNPTCRSLNALLNLSKEASSQHELVLLKKGKNTLPPIILFQPVTGLSTIFIHLIENLNISAPIYAFQDLSNQSGKLAFKSIDELSNEYMKKLLDLHPQSPYIFIGYSFGATVAYEIMTKLSKNKDGSLYEESKLIMIDGWAIFSDEQHDAHKFKKMLKEFYPDFSDQAVTLAWDRMSLLLKHKPVNSEIDFSLIKASLPLSEYSSIQDEFNGWKKYCKGVITRHVLEADHYAIMSKENAGTLAKYINDILETETIE